jgi:nicotinic acid phosphoribosyltransferase
MPEGTVFFPNEPILRVTAPLPQAQLVETRLINILHFQSLIAAKAARMVLSAPGKLLVDFGLRRAHGAKAGLLAARASYIAGVAGTATMLAGKRRILDDGGLRHVTIFASGGIDEKELTEAARQQAPIDGFGIGTSLTTSFDIPALDCAYKLQEYAGLPRRKRSTGKATWPGRKQVWRHYGPDGRIARDVLSVEGDNQMGEPLIQPVMKGGRRLAPQPTLAEIRATAARDLERLPEPLRRLEPGASCPVEVADALVRLADEVDRRLAQQARP